MKDYQVLIDHAWSLNPDLFEMFRQNFQIHLNKRRSIVEFQGKMKEGRRQLRQKRRIEQFHNSTRHPARDILPRKIDECRRPVHPSNTWVTPIERIHPPPTLTLTAIDSFEMLPRVWTIPKWEELVGRALGQRCQRGRVWPQWT